MGSVNKVILVGNLGRDAEMRFTPGGQAVATLNKLTQTIPWMFLTGIAGVWYAFYYNNLFPETTFSTARVHAASWSSASA